MKHSHYIQFKCTETHCYHSFLTTIIRLSGSVYTAHVYYGYSYRYAVLRCIKDIRSHDLQRTARTYRMDVDSWFSHLSIVNPYPYLTPSIILADKLPFKIIAQFDEFEKLSKIFNDFTHSALLCNATLKRQTAMLN